MQRFCPEPARRLKSLRLFVIIMLIILMTEMKI